MLDDDYGVVAGLDDEPTMPNGAQGSGRRPGASQRDGCAPRPPESTFRHRDLTILGFRGPFGRMGAELKFEGQISCWNL